MKTIFLIVLLMAIPVQAADIYRCGNTYTDKPCGTRIALQVPSPTCDDRVAAVSRAYEDKIKVQALYYSEREFDLIRAGISAPRMTQITSVDITSNNSAWAGADANASANIDQRRKRK